MEKYLVYLRNRCEGVSSGEELGLRVMVWGQTQITQGIVDHCENFDFTLNIMGSHWVLSET